MLSNVELVEYSSSSECEQALVHDNRVGEKIQTPSGLLQTAGIERQRQFAVETSLIYRTLNLFLGSEVDLVRIRTVIDSLPAGARIYTCTGQHIHQV